METHDCSGWLPYEYGEGDAYFNSDESGGYSEERACLHTARLTCQDLPLALGKYPCNPISLGEHRAEYHREGEPR